MTNFPGRGMLCQSGGPTRVPRVRRLSGRSRLQPESGAVWQQPIVRHWVLLGSVFSRIRGRRIIEGPWGTPGSFDYRNVAAKGELATALVDSATRLPRCARNDIRRQSKGPGERRFVLTPAPWFLYHRRRGFPQGRPKCRYTNTDVSLATWSAVNSSKSLRPRPT